MKTRGGSSRARRPTGMPRAPYAPRARTGRDRFGGGSGRRVLPRDRLAHSGRRLHGSQGIDGLGSPVHPGRGAAVHGGLSPACRRAGVLRPIWPAGNGTRPGPCWPGPCPCPGFRPGCATRPARGPACAPRPAAPSPWAPWSGFARPWPVRWPRPGRCPRAGARWRSSAAASAVLARPGNWPAGASTCACTMCPTAVDWAGLDPALLAARTGQPGAPGRGPGAGAGPGAGRGRSLVRHGPGRLRRYRGPAARARRRRGARRRDPGHEPAGAFRQPARRILLCLAPGGRPSGGRFRRAVRPEHFPGHGPHGRRPLPFPAGNGSVRGGTGPGPDPAAGFTEAAASAEAGRCLHCQCLTCVAHCAVLEKYKSYPKAYARQIYNNSSNVVGIRQANTMINSCMLCGRCEVVCPGNFSMAAVCLDARRIMVAPGPDAGLRPMNSPCATWPVRRQRGAAPWCAMPRGRAREQVPVFFPGCQLPASDPDGVDRRLCRPAPASGTYGGGVAGLFCCGAPAHWAGRRKPPRWPRPWPACASPVARRWGKSDPDRGLPHLFDHPAPAGLPEVPGCWPTGPCCANMGLPRGAAARRDGLAPGHRATPAPPAMIRPCCANPCGICRRALGGLPWSSRN